MSSLPAALAMMSPGEALPGVRSEAGTAAAREPVAIGAMALAALAAPALAVHGGRAALVGATGHSAMTGGLTRGTIAQHGRTGAGQIGTASVAARC